MTASVDDIGTADISGTLPPFYFDPKNWPESDSIPLMLPPDFRDDPETFRELLAAEVEVQTAEARAEVKRKGWEVLGRIRAMNPGMLSLIPYSGPPLAESRGVPAPSIVVEGATSALCRHNQIPKELPRAWHEENVMGIWLYFLAFALQKTNVAIHQTTPVRLTRESSHAQSAPIRSPRGSSLIQGGQAPPRCRPSLGSDPSSPSQPTSRACPGGPSAPQRRALSASPAAAASTAASP